METRKLEINENSEKRFYHGKINFLIRLYYYTKEGVGQMNSLRTLGYALIGIAGVMAIDGVSDYGFIVKLGLIILPVFTLLGWLWVKRGKRSEEYFNLKYASTFGKYGVELQEEQMRLLEEISNKLDKLIEKK